MMAVILDRDPAISPPFPLNPCKHCNTVTNVRLMKPARDSFIRCFTCGHNIGPYRNAIDACLDWNDFPKYNREKKFAGKNVPWKPK